MGRSREAKAPREKPDFLARLRAGLAGRGGEEGALCVLPPWGVFPL